MKFNPKITLTQDGANVDLTDFDVKTEVRDKARSYGRNIRLRTNRKQASRNTGG